MDKPQDIGLDAKSPAERDRIDLNHEIAGRDTGRIKRFFPNSFSVSGETQEQKEERRFQSMLEMLLSQDPYYAALYEKVAKKLDKAQQAVDRALMDVNQRLDESARLLHILRHSAAELDDGTKIFKSSVDGNIYTEEGRKLSDEEAQDIEIPENAPSWEAHQSAQAAYETALGQKQEIETYQREVLDPMAERMQNEDDPPSMEELEKFQENIENHMPDAVKAEFMDHDPAILSANKVFEDTGLEVPDMAGDFDLARIDTPELDNPALETEARTQPANQVVLKPITLG